MRQRWWDASSCGRAHHLAEYCGLHRERTRALEASENACHYRRRCSATGAGSEARTVRCEGPAGLGLDGEQSTGLHNQLKAHMNKWPAAKRYAMKCKAGIPVPLVDVRVVDESGDVSRDGRTMGEIQLRGP